MNKISKKHKDIICGAIVNEDIEFISKYRGEKYYFHSEKCKELFDKDPQYFIEEWQKLDTP